MRLDIRTPGPPVIWIAIIEVGHQPEPGHYDDGGDGLLLNPGGGPSTRLSITYSTIDTVMISPRSGCSFMTAAKRSAMALRKAVAPDLGEPGLVVGQTAGEKLLGHADLGVRHKHAQLR